ncbi:MAG TPA: hypothetical protein EYQ27_11615, partial [Gemmatimonadetes bacterium]|nr:hypothetical protein [Gemmatimonadota bacterium]
MKKPNWSLTIGAGLLLTPLAGGAQEPVYWDIVDRIRTEGFENSHVMEHAGYLTDVIGPRFTGSPNMREAQEWAAGRMSGFGLSRIELEPWGDQTVADEKSDCIRLFRHTSCSGLPLPEEVSSKGIRLDEILQEWFNAQENHQRSYFAVVGQHRILAS